VFSLLKSALLLRKNTRIEQDQSIKVLQQQGRDEAKKNSDRIPVSSLAFSLSMLI